MLSVPDGEWEGSEGGQSAACPPFALHGGSAVALPSAPADGERPRISDETGLGRRSFAHGSGLTFAAMSGARVTRYVALLHLRTQTSRSGRERFLSLVAPVALSQVNPCIRI